MVLPASRQRSVKVVPLLAADDSVVNRLALEPEWFTGTPWTLERLRLCRGKQPQTCGKGTALSTGAGIDQSL